MPLTLIIVRRPYPRTNRRFSSLRASPNYSFLLFSIACRNGLQPVSCAPSCLPTCQTPEPVCPPSLCVPGCGCPDDTVYDEVKQECVSIASCGMIMYI